MKGRLIDAYYLFNVKYTLLLSLDLKFHEVTLVAKLHISCSNARALLITVSLCCSNDRTFDLRFVPCSMI